MRCYWTTTVENAREALRHRFTDRYEEFGRQGFTLQPPLSALTTGLAVKSPYAWRSRQPCSTNWT
jgi:hypothetical protein